MLGRRGDIGKIFRTSGRFEPVASRIRYMDFREFPFYDVRE
jgi:hypothetical protein